MRLFLIFLFVITIFNACTETGNKEILLYEGPLQEVENVELYYSENDHVKVKMLADLAYEFQNGDREFPKGIYLEFYDELGNKTSTLSANHAYYFKEENKWRGRGDVEVKNLQKNEQLNTEELFWTPANEKIFTDKFVTIKKQSDVIYGNGLDAKQDLSTYEIFDINDSEASIEDE